MRGPTRREPFHSRRGAREDGGERRSPPWLLGPRRTAFPGSRPGSISGSGVGFCCLRAAAAGEARTVFAGKGASGTMNWQWGNSDSYSYLQEIILRTGTPPYTAQSVAPARPRQHRK